jgi:hypothetical protein
MVERLRRRLTYANVTATLALFLVLTGGIAWALERNSVKSKHIVNGQVKGADVDEASLGTVPSATSAQNADTLDGTDSTGFAAAADAPLWAFVDNHAVQGGNACEVKRSSGGVAAEQTGDGCMVDFGRNVSQCGYMASLGEEVYDQTDLPGEIGVKPGFQFGTLGPSNELVLVETQSSDGGAELAKPFYVAAFC